MPTLATIMSNLFFTADHHFNHSNIIRYCKRPFQSVEEMNEVLIARWNERVQPEDEVYHLGDIGFGSPAQLRPILDQLHGKIYLIKGNHDKLIHQNINRFQWIKSFYELTVPDTSFKLGHHLIVLCHYALKVWNASHWGTYHLYGHSHGALPDDPKSRSFDVGVDCHNFYPLSYEEVKDIMKQKEWTRPQHLRT